MQEITELKEKGIAEMSFNNHHFLMFKRAGDFSIMLVNTKQYEEALANYDLTFSEDMNWNVANLIAVVKFKQPVEGHEVSDVIEMLRKEIFNIGLNTIINGNRSSQ